MKRLLLLIFLSLCFSCRSSKVSNSTSDKEERSRDSIVYKEKTIIKEGINDTIYIDNPCDSITGGLKPILTKIKAQTGSVSLESLGGTLILTTSIPTSVSTVREDINHSSSHSKDYQTEYKKVKVYVWSKWTYIFLIIAIVEAIALFYLVPGLNFTKLINPIKNLLKW